MGPSRTPLDFSQPAPLACAGQASSPPIPGDPRAVTDPAYPEGQASPTLEHELETVSGKGAGLTWELRDKPSYATLHVELRGGTLRAESGAMVAMTDGLESDARMFGGLGAVVRKVFGGESLFMTEYSGGGKVSLAPTLVGDIAHFSLSGRNEIVSQAGAFLAATGGVEMRPSFAGLRGIFGGEGAFFLRHSGEGDLFLNAYGAIVEVDVSGTYVVDTGHLVAWESLLDYKVKGAGGLKSLLFSGEGLVLEFQGRGTLWIQTRTLGGFVRSLIPHLPR